MNPKFRWSTRRPPPLYPAHLSSLSPSLPLAAGAWSRRNSGNSAHTLILPSRPEFSAPQLLVTPPSKPRGFSFRDHGSFAGTWRKRDVAAMSSPALDSVPIYMRATRSSGTKADQSAGAPSSASTARQRRPVRVATTRGLCCSATCSLTMKEAKFPGALDLAPRATDGPASMRLYPYTYCYLNGHAHAPAVPLQKFLARSRWMIKMQPSMNHRGVSVFRYLRRLGNQHIFPF